MQKNKCLFSFFEYASLIAFIPFLVLTIYNRPSADDLFLYYEANVRGIPDAFYYMYTRVSSRYTSLFVLFLLTGYKFFLENYFIVPLLLLGCMYGGIYACLKPVNEYVFNRYLGRRELHTVSRLFLLLFIVVMPEPSTGFYWISGAITHMLPVVLLLYAVAFLLKSMFRENPRAYLALSAAFLFFTIGCNEMLALYLLVLFFGLAAYSKYHHLHFFRHFLVLFVVAAIGNALLFLSTGQQNRAGHFYFQSSIPYALAASFLKYFLLLGKLFSAPFFWFCMALLFLMAKQVSSGFRFSFNILWWGIYFLALPLVLYFLVYLVNPAGVPERANNPLAFIVLISVSLLVWHLAFSLSDIFSFQANRMVNGVICVSFIITMVFSKNYLLALENQFSGPIYSYIFDKRVHQIQHTRKAGMKKVELDPYEVEWENYIPTRIPAMFRQPMTKLVDPYPDLIFFCDDVSNAAWITSYAEYYNIDTIVVNGQDHLRFTLDEYAKQTNNGFK